MVTSKEGAMKIYTMGYTGRTMEDIAAMLEQLDAVLIDCRYVPFSRAPMWRKAAFQTALPDEAQEDGSLRPWYRWMKGFGNENYRTPGMENVRLHNPDMHLGDVRALTEHYSLVLMCACEDATRCHRRHVSHWVAQNLGLPDSVIEDLPPASPRARTMARAQERQSLKGRIEGLNRGPMGPPSQRDLFGA